MSSRRSAGGRDKAASVFVQIAYHTTGIFRLGFLQDGDVGVGVFPEREEVLIGGSGFGQGVLL
jgi:hypothetical protein